MKVVKGVLYFILIMIVATLLAALFAPSRLEVTHKITIDREPYTVYSQLINLKKWKKWDPWYSLDSTQSREYKGSLGSKNYGFNWQSENTDLQSGSLQITRLLADEEVDFTIDLNIAKQKSEGNGHFELKPQGSQTVVNWTMVSAMGYPSRLLNYFMKEPLIARMELGLANLKVICEESESKDTSTSFLIETTSLFGREYLGIRANKIPMGEVQKFYALAYDQLYAHAQVNGVEASGAASGLMYSWDFTNNEATLMAAIPTSREKQKNTKRIPIGSDTALLAIDNISYIYDGGYTKGYSVHTALSAWLDSTGRVAKMPVLETYIVGPRQTADTNMYKTKITYHFSKE